MNVMSSNRKIDPTRRRATTMFKPDGTPLDNDRVEIGPTDLAFNEWAALGITPPDMPKLREYRLSRIVGELQKHDYAGLVTFDPLNIRYITDSTNMQLARVLSRRMAMSCCSIFTAPSISAHTCPSCAKSATARVSSSSRAQVSSSNTPPISQNRSTN
jgi:hypothetical protein